MTMPASAHALPKINLYLEVLGKRADGYHEIATVFLPLAAPLDEVTVSPAPAGELRVTCAHPGVPGGPANLCWRVATEFAREAGLVPAWEVELRKRIPVAAGLGGGSSDAAALLRLLDGLYPGALARDRLAALAARLGADVAFFLDPRPALGRGIGEVLTPVTCGASLEIVLASPGFPVAAAWAYANRGRVPLPPAPPLGELLAALAAGSLDGVARLTHNALEYAVLDKFPLVRLLRDALLAQGCLCAHVSGSGPTVYGLCRSGSGDAVVASLGALYGQAVWTCVTRSVQTPDSSQTGG
jgi:4-diphosphocytidyl-2-C-methyl-D-erythritol kinase